MCLLDDITWDACAKNPGGMYDESYFGEIADVETWPVVDDTPAAFGDDVVTTGDIEMLTGKRMYKLYTTQDTSEVVDTLVGEVDGKSWETTYDCFTPGTHKEVLAIAATFANGNWFFVPRERGGNFRIVGGPGRPAKLVEGSIRTAKDAKGRKGFMFKVMVFGPTPAPIYTSGTIPLV